MEKALLRVPGVLAAQVNQAIETATVSLVDLSDLPAEPGVTRESLATQSESLATRGRTLSWLAETGDTPRLLALRGQGEITAMVGDGVTFLRDQRPDR